MSKVKCKLCAKELSKDGGITSRPRIHRHQTSRCAMTSLTSWTTMLVMGKCCRFTGAVSKTPATLPRAPTHSVSRSSLTTQCPKVASFRLSATSSITQCRPKTDLDPRENQSFGFPQKRGFGFSFKRPRPSVLYLCLVCSFVIMIK